MPATRMSRRRRLGGVVLALAVLLPVAGVAGPPFRTDGPEQVDYQHWEMNLPSQGTQVYGANQFSYYMALQLTL